MFLRTVSYLARCFEETAPHSPRPATAAVIPDEMLALRQPQGTDTGHVSDWLYYSTF